MTITTHLNFFENQLQDVTTGAVRKNSGAYSQNMDSFFVKDEEMIACQFPDPYGGKCCKKYTRGTYRVNSQSQHEKRLTLSMILKLLSR